MREPEVALAFTADLWVEGLHRHLTDHGGARVRTLLVEARGRARRVVRRVGRRASLAGD